MSHHLDDRPFSARTPFSFLLGIVSVVLLPVALALAWLSAVGTRADLFVDTLGPVVRTTEVQQSLTSALTGQAMAQVQTVGRERPIVEAAVRRGVTEVVASEQFANIWADAVRSAHAQLVSAIGASPSPTQPTQPTASTSSATPNGAPDANAGGGAGVEVVVRVPLDAVQGRLTSLGVTVPADLAPMAKVSVLSASQVERIRPLYSLLSSYGLWAPFVVVGLGVLAVGLAVLRRRAALWLLGGWGFGLALLAAGLALARPVAVDLLVATVDRSSGAQLPLRAVALAAYDAAAASFQRWLVVGGVAVAVLLLLTVLAAVLARPHRAHRPRSV